MLMPVGQRLRNGREEKGVSRVDVSQETKIAVHHLAALEYSDFKELPDMVHVKGYVRAYAEYLGLEPTAILEEFLEEYQAQLPAQDTDPRDEVVRKMSKLYGSSQAPWTRRLRPLLIVAALAMIALLAWVGWGRFGSDDPTTDAGTAAPMAAESAPTENADPQRYVVIREREQETPAEPAPTPASTPTTPPAMAAAAEPAKPEPQPTPPPQPTPLPEPKTTPRVTPASATRLRIQQYGVGTGVENRQLLGESDRFSLGTKVAFFTRVEGGRAGDTVRHVWRHQGAEIASIPLRIGGANWRTYSRKTMHAGSAGAWTVEAVDGNGNVLAVSRFNCLP